MEKRKVLRRVFDVIFWMAIVGFIAFKFGYQRMAPSVAFDNLTMVDETGKEFTLVDFEGKNILINFYQSWCGPCMGEMPALSNAYVQLKDDDFVFIALTDEPFDLIDRVKNRSNNQMIFLQTQSSLDEIGIRVYPTTYLLDKKGDVVFEKVDVQLWDSQEQLLQFRSLVAE